MVRVSLSWFESVLIGLDRFKLVSIWFSARVGSNYFELVRVGSNRFELFRVGSNRLFRVASIGFKLVRVGSNRF